MKKKSLNKKTGWLKICILTGMLVLSGMPAAVYADGETTAEFAGGDGTLDSPYQVETAEHLENVGSYLGSHFIQTDNITLPEVNSDHGESNWTPIGTEENPFTGTYDGDGFTISGLTIADNTLSYLGLFGYVGSGGNLENVNLENVNINSFKQSASVGGLVGWNEGSVSAGSISGSVAGGYGARVGGLVGWNDGDVSNSNSSGMVTGGTDTSVDTNVGGLVGRNEGSVSNSGSSSDVTGLDIAFTGGLVGWNEGSVSNSSSSGDVRGGNAVGGLVGINKEGSISGSHSSGNVTGVESLSVSGLAGASLGGSISDSHSSGDVTGEGAAYVAGLIGMSEGVSLSNSYNSGNIRGDGFVGGLVSYNNGSMSSSYNSGSVSSGNGATVGIGGLVSLNLGSGSVSSSYNSGSVTGGNGARVGGLAGYNNGSVSNSYNNGSVSGDNDAIIGGLVGANNDAAVSVPNNGSVSNSYNSGSISGENEAAIGALAGANYSGGIVGESYYDSESSGQSDAFGIPKPTAEMKRQATFDGWDFGSAWRISEDGTYPLLQWQDRTADERISADRYALSWDSIKDANSAADNITADLDLPANGAEDSDINWSVSPDDGCINTSTGVVTRPGYSEGDKNVTLTAAISYPGGTSQTKTFDLTVIRALPYTVTYIGNGNTGGTVPVDSGAYSHGSTVTVLGNTGSLTRSGHTFAGWSHDGIDYTAGNTFTITGNMELYARWISTQDSSGRNNRENNTPPPAPAALMLSDIKAEVTKGGVAEPILDVDVTSANSAAVDLGTLGGDIFTGDKVTTVTMPHVDGINAYVLELPASALSKPQGESTLAFSTNIGSLIIGDNMLTAIAGIKEEKAAIAIGKGDTTLLADEVKAALGDRPIIQLTLTLAGTQTEWNNPEAPVTVSISYTPTAEELADPEHIVVWYIDGSGNAVSVPSGRYDPETGTVTFNTTHFSRYAVAYVHKTFSDLGGSEWARKPIEVMASKGIVNGTSKDTFSPAASITRADYLALLIKTLGLTADFEGNFDDVKQGAYYYDALGIAKKLGIATGNDNRFNPKENISRQDMMALTARALEKYKGLTAAGDTAVLDQFSDKDDTAEYAVTSMASLVKEGFITGAGDKLNPRTSTARAEAAAFLYRIYKEY